MTGATGASPFTLSGSHAVFTTGNLGLGTTTPGALLSFGANANAQQLLMFESDGFGNKDRYGFGIQASELRAFAPATAALTFGTINRTDGATFTERMRVTDSGLGVTGDVNITGTFKVNGTAIGAGALTGLSGTTNRVSVSSGNAPVVDIDAAYAGQTSITTLGTITTGTVPVAHVSGLAAVATSGSASDLTTGTLAVPYGGTGATSLSAGSVLVGNGTGAVLQPSALNWDNTNGRLGIATATPGARLSFGTSADAKQLLIYEDTALKDYYGFGIGSAELRQFFSSNGHLAIGSVSKTDGTTFSELMRVSADGRVGIGTAAPAYLLDVAGDVNVSGAFRVNGTTLPSGTVTSVTGTTDRITVSNGTSTPSVDIAATYAGQTSITTLGTIATGTVPAANVSGLGSLATLSAINNGNWSGTPLSIDNGGTGSTTQTFVDLSTGQTIGGAKAFSAGLMVQGMTVGLGGGAGETNAALGIGALPVNTTGSRNTALGVYALNSNTVGWYNTATGFGSLQSNTTGYANTATGRLALNGNNGNYNTAIGDSALEMNAAGANNAALGVFAGRSMTGSNNTALGSGAGQTLVYGSNNIYLGQGTAPSGVGTSGTPVTNEIVIGQGATGQGSNSTLIGNTSTLKTFIAGISGATPAGATQTVVIDASGQLGSTDATSTRSSLGLGSLATKSSLANADVASDAAIATSKLSGAVT
ncbi:MAG: hypothetical protein WCK63_18125, partial [Betaproteobacteria bacterium]